MSKVGRNLETSKVIVVNPKPTVQRGVQQNTIVPKRISILVTVAGMNAAGGGARQAGVKRSSKARRRRVCGGAAAAAPTAGYKGKPGNQSSRAVPPW